MRTLSAVWVCDWGFRAMLRLLLSVLLTLAATGAAAAHDFAPPSARQIARFWSLGFGQGYHSLPVEPHWRPHYLAVQRRPYAPVVLPPPYPAAPLAPELSDVGGLFLAPPALPRPVAAPWHP